MISKEIRKIVDRAAEGLYQEIEPLDFAVEYPKQKKYGDYASNIAMILAKKLNKSPMDVAEEIVGELNKEKENKELFNKIEIAKPGFINFTLADKFLYRQLGEIIKLKDDYGRSEIGKNKIIVIDYSHPNIAKPMHAGHMRSTIIGQAICNTYKFLGYQVIADNHLGDWGTHFGKLIVAYRKWGDKKIIDQNPIVEITKLYVRFNKEAENNSELEDEARLEVKKLQDGDEENLKLWKFFVEESLKEFEKVYQIFGTKFDYVLGESFYQPMLAEIVKNALDKKVAVESEGAVVILLETSTTPPDPPLLRGGEIPPLKKGVRGISSPPCEGGAGGGLPPFLIQKSDGAYLYGTTDLAAIKYRKEKFKADKMFYVVSNEQALYFSQLFESAELLGLAKKENLVHIKYGLVLGKDGKKLSTRKGEAVSLTELIDKAISLAREIVEKKNPGLNEEEKNKIARAVGVGALKYNDLSQNRLTDIAFNWDKMLSLSGNSAPYLQYTGARIESILRKAEKENFKTSHGHSLPRRGNNKTSFDLLMEDIEKDIIRSLVKFPEIVEKSAEEYNPNIIADYLFQLASDFNLFYQKLPVLKAEPKLRQARLELIFAVSLTLKNGLSLLGIEVLERM